MSGEADPAPGSAASAQVAGEQPPDAVALDAASSATRFRIFKRGPWRRAFRLEDAFWETLEQAAAAEGLKLADYVRRLAAGCADGVNVSAQMRVQAVEWLAQRCRSLEAETAPDRLMAAVLAAPVPGFVISAARDLVRSNAEFQAYLGARARQAGIAEAGPVTMALDAPVARVVALLAAEEGRALACGFTIRSGAVALNGRARVTLLPPGRDLIVGFVLPEEGSPA